jgi:hypothetical protein
MLYKIKRAAAAAAAVAASVACALVVTIASDLRYKNYIRNKK